MQRNFKHLPVTVGAALTVLTATVFMAPMSATATTSLATKATYKAPLRTAITSLPVAGEVRTGYKRTLFPIWKDADGDCQSTRNEVLIAESTTTVTYTTTRHCVVAKGRWSSYYDRATWVNPADVDIDHLVPLAEAWDSGARAWSTPRRQAYANDLGDPRTLIAVTDNVNQAKGDQDPSTWLPTYDVCRYVQEWTAVKIRWGLTVDTIEKATLTRKAAKCANVTLTVVKA